MLDIQLFGLQAPSHHLMSVWLHALNAALLFIFLRRATGDYLPSLIVGLLFANHPINVESVAWVAERKNVLSTTFALLTLIAYTRYAASGNFWLYLCVFGLYVMGLMTKPMLVSLPVLLFLIDFWPLRRIQGQHATQSFAKSAAAEAPAVPTGGLTAERPVKCFGFGEVVMEKVPLILLAAASCLLTYAGQREIGAVWPAEALPFAVRAANALVSLWLYLGKLFVPVNLALFYPHPGAWPAGTVLLALAGSVAATYLALELRQAHAHLLFGWAWFLLGLLPVLGFIQVGGQGMADRYAYLTFIGPFVALVWSAYELLRAGMKLKTPVVASVVVLLGLTLACEAQIRYWKTPARIWEHTASVTSRNGVAEQQAGILLYNSGDHQRALHHFLVALSYEPIDPRYWPTVGLCYQKLGDKERARVWFRSIAGRGPRGALGEVMLGNSYLAEKDFTNALRHARAALRVSPTDPAATALLMGIPASAGGWGSSDTALLLRTARIARVVQGDTWRTFGWLARAYEERGDYERAADFAAKALAVARVNGTPEAMESARDKLRELLIVTHRRFSGWLLEEQVGPGRVASQAALSATRGISHVARAER